MFFHNVTHFSNGYRLIKGKVHNTTAGKINTKIEATENHRANTDNQENNGNREENLIMIYNRELTHYLATSLVSVVFGVRAPNQKGLLIKLL